MTNNYLINEHILYDSERGELYKLNAPEKRVKLSKPSATCLQSMIDAKHQIVSQDNLTSEIWGQKGVIVGPNTLYQHIYMLRKSLITLGLNKNFIKTTPRCGVHIPEEFTIIAIDAESRQEPANQRQEHIADTQTINRFLAIERYAITGFSRLPRKTYMLYLTLFIVMTAAFMQYIYSHWEPISGNYSLLGQYNNCSIYGNSSDFKLPYVTARMIKRGIFCKKNSKRFLYYSGNKKTKIESIFSCDKKISGRLKATCKSFYWSGYES